MKAFATTFPILLLLLAPAALAQDPEPDTTDASRYLPFHLGNVWEYERWEDRDCSPEWPPICQHEHVGYFRREVVGDSTVEGTTYWQVEETRYNLNGLPTALPTALVRFDTTAARAYSLRFEEEEPWPDWFVCPHDLPFGVYVACEYEDYVEVIGMETDLLGAPRFIKNYLLAPGYDSYSFSPDIGLTWVSYGKFTQNTQRIVYARVDGVEYGTRFPVATEAAPEAARFGLALHPNPLRAEGTLTLHLDRPERVRVEAFDVLGRRVATIHDGALPPGEHALSFDASGLPPGLYVIRSVSASASRAIRATVTR